MGASFIGARPDDAGLITVKGKRLLEDADTVIYPGFLDQSGATWVLGWKRDDHPHARRPCL